MVAVTAGLLTALVWATTTIVSAKAARIIGPLPTLGWVVLIGTLVTIPLLTLDRLPGPADTNALTWLAVAGLAYVLGMALGLSALAGGKIPVAAPITSSEGAVAATIAVITGEAAGLPLLVMLAVVAGGVFLTALEPGSGSLDVPAGGDSRYVAFAVAAAASFGVGLYASGRVSGSVPLVWVAAAGRVAGLALIALPLILTRRLTFKRAALPFLLIAGVAEVTGMLTFAWGATESIAVTAILSSQFAVIAALVAGFMGERIAPRQWVGVLAVSVGVTAITIGRL